MNPYASNLEDFPTIVTAWFSFSSTPPPIDLSSLIDEFGPEAVERAIVSVGRGSQLDDFALLRRMAHLSRQFIELEREEAA